MQWYKKLGFSSYPLDPRSNPNLVAVDTIEQRIISYILQGNMCLLSGFTGSGKTSMLQRLQQSEELADFRFVFISADGVKRSFLIEDAIKSSRSFIEMLTFKRPRNLIVMLDESQLANRLLTESIKSKWNHTYPNGDKVIQSVIVSQIEGKLGTNFTGSFIDRLGHRIVQMKQLKPQELAKVLSIRLDSGKRNYAKNFTKEGMSFLTKSADGSVRQLLEYTDVIFRGLCSIDPNPLLKKGFKIDKPIVFNFLQQAGLSAKAGKKGQFEKILKTKRLREAIEMFEQFGTLSPVLLAEKLDTSKANAQKILNELKKKEAIIFSHEDDDLKYFVLAPRLKHELVKA